MNLHEYQGKQLFKEYGLPVSEGVAADTPHAAVEAADRIGGTEWVVKCQVHAGGRGKAGGVKLVQTAGLKARRHEQNVAPAIQTDSIQHCKHKKTSSARSKRVEIQQRI